MRVSHGPGEGGGEGLWRYLLQHAGRELHGLLVLLLKHVHVQVVQKVVSVIVHPALVQLGRRSSSQHRPQKRFLLFSFYSLLKSKDIPCGKARSWAPSRSRPSEMCPLVCRLSETWPPWRERDLPPYAMSGPVSGVHGFIFVGGQPCIHSSYLQWRRLPVEGGRVKPAQPAGPPSLAGPEQRLVTVWEEFFLTQKIGVLTSCLGPGPYLPSADSAGG